MMVMVIIGSFFSSSGGFQNSELFPEEGPEYAHILDLGSSKSC